jgi:peptide/nickel transport system permease protein
MRARLLVQRLVSTIPVLFLVTVGIFGMLHLAPGDPISVLIGDQLVDAQVVAKLREEMHLDEPFPVQYLTWLERAVRGDFGYSFATRQPVAKALGERFPVTLQLTIMALTLALLIAVPLGALAAVRRRSALDALNQLLAMLGGSMPAFWLGILLILLFALKLRWLPPSGYTPFIDNPGNNLKGMLLPALTLSAGYAAVICRVVRASMLEVLADDFIRTARAKGLAERAVIVRHALRSALLPIITVIGLEAGHLLAGAVVTETVFALPGMGRLLVEAVTGRDFPIVQGATLILVSLLVGCNLIADLLYAAADPRVSEA